jgi:hypothetical protein
MNLSRLVVMLSGTEAFKSISVAFSLLMNLDDFVGGSMFSKEDLVQIIPTATEVTISAAIRPTAATIVPTCATISPSAPKDMNDPEATQCSMCLGCGKFFDTQDELKTHQLHRYNCTIHIADSRRKQDDGH